MHVRETTVINAFLVIPMAERERLQNTRKFLWRRHIATPHHRCNRDHDSWLKKKKYFLNISRRKNRWKLKNGKEIEKFLAFSVDRRRKHISGKQISILGAEVLFIFRIEFIILWEVGGKSFRLDEKQLSFILNDFVHNSIRGILYLPIWDWNLFSFPSAFARFCLSTACVL